MHTTLIWFRQDLRLTDNPALQAALKSGNPIICLFIFNQHTIGQAALWWLHHSLIALSKTLEKCGNTLILRLGDPEKILAEIISQHHVQNMYWNRLYDSTSITRDKNLKTYWRAQGLTVESFNSHLLFEPWTVSTQQGNFYQVFTPFWRKGCGSGKNTHYTLNSAPKTLPAPQRIPHSDRLDDWKLLPQKPDWAKMFSTLWTPGEIGAKKQLTNFLNHGLARYTLDRNVPALQNTSKLSPHLHWGEISIHRVWDTLLQKESQDKTIALNNIECFQSELGWREFSYYLLYHFPPLPQENFKKKFDNFRWENSTPLLKTWQNGLTGYPIVDAGMRELWHTGWMHNRVRMIVASFLVKDLLIDWRKGAAWFLDTLVDADLANNSASWQWVAGSGVDAAPFFRIFNPVHQSEKFDPQGEYVRKWIPEIKLLPDKYLHAPWQAPEDILTAANIKLGKTYPFPIIDHKQARSRALAMLKSCQ